MTSIENLQQNSGASGTYSGLAPTRLATGDDFFRILAAQMQAQDPLDPTSQTEFLSQLTQFAQLQTALDTSAQLGVLSSVQQAMAGLETMTQSAALIGRRVDYVDLETGESRSGVVNGVSAEQGQVVLDVEGTSVTLDAITAIHSEE